MLPERDSEVQVLELRFGRQIRKGWGTVWQSMKSRSTFGSRSKWTLSTLVSISRASVF